jgi:pantoate--beta-alanine ligase|tara:strand:- start:2090 stop:2899 length:810 start_codon:yes stop_codon:yes gene_type:complete
LIVARSTEYSFSKHSDIAFIATMGNLHDGHLALVKNAKSKSNFVVVSIFINPLQFNDPEDLNNYPKSLEVDLEILELAGCDLVFIPDNAILINLEPIKAQDLSNTLCGKSRPGHFDGVLTIVNRLFEIIDPKIAYFGLKDYQQYLLIKNYAALYYPNLMIIGCSTERNKSGLALSSRNNLLNDDQVKLAANIYIELNSIKTNYTLNNLNLLKDKATKNLQELGFKIDYLEAVDALSLGQINDSTITIIVAIAAYLGDIRLIDNIIISKF